MSLRPWRDWSSVLRSQLSSSWGLSRTVFRVGWRSLAFTSCVCHWRLWWSPSSCWTGHSAWWKMVCHEVFFPQCFPFTFSSLLLFPGANCELYPVFDPRLSPRNFVLLASKWWHPVYCRILWLQVKLDINWSHEYGFVVMFLVWTLAGNPIPMVCLDGNS